MTLPPKSQTTDTPQDGATTELTRAQIERLEGVYGNRYLLEPAPDHKLPKSGMSTGCRLATWRRS
jgi:hypothetical protein